MTFRLIIDPSLDGATNMARDEALLEAVGRSESPPTLRFYQWSPATISLGYFQDYTEYEALPPPAGGLTVVRRQTGGGAILHDLELTYSLTVPINHPFVSGNPSRMYERVHDEVATLLCDLGVPVERGLSSAADALVGGTHSSGCSQRGPFFCFERHGPIDLLAGGRKILGSAQRRTPTAVLQHGSLIIDSRYPQQKCATIQEFTTVDLASLIRQLSARIAVIQLEASTLTATELRRADELCAKYAGSDWTRRQ